MEMFRLCKCGRYLLSDDQASMAVGLVELVEVSEARIRSLPGWFNSGILSTASLVNRVRN